MLGEALGRQRATEMVVACIWSMTSQPYTHRADAVTLLRFVTHRCRVRDLNALDAREGFPARLAVPGKRENCYDRGVKQARCTRQPLEIHRTSAGESDGRNYRKLILAREDSIYVSALPGRERAAVRP